MPSDVRPPSAPRNAPPANPAAAAGRPQQAAAAGRAPTVHLAPRPCDVYVGPFPKVAPARAQSQMAARLERLVPEVAERTTRSLVEHTGWQTDLGAVEVCITDRAGLRSTLRNEEGFGRVTAFLLSWSMAVIYAPGLAKVLVVGARARRYDDATLRFQLARALVGAAIGQVHRDFYDHIARLLISVRGRAHDIYACRAWAHALGEAVATDVAPRGRKGPVLQRLGQFFLWPLARFLIGPQRLGRRLVAVLKQVRRERPELIDRTFKYRSLCNALYSPPGRRLMVAPASPDYQRKQLGEDARYLRGFNRNGGALAFSAES